MEYRLSSPAVAAGALQPMLGLEAYLKTSSIEASLLHLVKLRVSQMNGCAYCLDMHSKDLRAAGETEQRLYLLDAWREAPLYTPRERAALEWAESLTFVTNGHVPDDVFSRAKAELSETELVDLSLAVATINAWNRLCIAFRVPAGTYEPAQQNAAEVSRAK